MLGNARISTFSFYLNMKTTLREKEEIWLLAKNKNFLGKGEIWSKLSFKEVKEKRKSVFVYHISYSSTCDTDHIPN